MLVRLQSRAPYKETPRDKLCCEAFLVSGDGEMPFVEVPSLSFAMPQRQLSVRCSGCRTQHLAPVHTLSLDSKIKIMSSFCVNDPIDMLDEI